jgi:hypothetical protein
MKNKRVFFSMTTGCLLGVFLLVLLAFSDASYAQSAPVYTRLAKLINPPDGAEIIAKKPSIQVAILKPYVPDTLLVILDGIDITGVLDLTAQGFAFTPIEILPSGPHVLMVEGATQDGWEFREEFAFSTRHSKTFEEAYSRNEVTAVYENLVKSPDKTLAGDGTKTEEGIEGISDWRVDSNLSSKSFFREKGWQMSFNTNIRYLNQELPALEPEKRGLDLIDFLLTGAYTRDQMEFYTEIGDTLVDESEHTVSYLARRGGQASVQYGDFKLRGFAVKGEEVYGFEGGLGIDTNDDDHIIGGSAEAGFFDNRLTLKAIYATGGEEGSYFGTYSADGPRKGETSGLVLKTDFFDQKLTTEFEVDYSLYDSDTSDDYSSEGDNAYRLKVGGQNGRYTYEALYKYLGPDYEVIGNQHLDKDTEGFELYTGALFENHSIDLSLSDYWDNVESDNLYSRIYTYQGRLDYSYKKFQSMPMGVTYEKSKVDSSKEPIDIMPTKIDTDTVSGTMSYIKGPWWLNLLASCSDQDDKTEADNDTTITTYSFIPTYTSDHFAISTGFNVYNTIYHLTDVDIDTYTVTLDIRGDTFQGKIAYELSGTYDSTKSSDDLTDQHSIRGDCKITYFPGENLWGYVNPSVGLKVLYDKTNDRVSDIEDEEIAIMLVLAVSTPFSW